MGDGRLPEPWRTIKNRMVEWLSPLFRRFDADPQRLLHARLPDVLVEGLRAQRCSMLRSSSVNCVFTNSLGHDVQVSWRYFVTVSVAVEGISAAAARRLARSRHTSAIRRTDLSHLESDREDSVPSAPIDTATAVLRLDFRNELARTSFRSRDIPRGRTRKPPACSHPSGTHWTSVASPSLQILRRFGHAGCGIAFRTFPAGLADALRLCGRLIGRTRQSQKAHKERRPKRVRDRTTSTGRFVCSRAWSTPCQFFQAFTDEFLERQGSGARLLSGL